MPERLFTRWSSLRIVPGEHLEQGDLADERVGDGLEHDGERLPGGIGRHLDLGVAGPDGGGPVGGRGTDLHEQIREPVDADLGRGRAAHHGEHAGRLDAEGEGVLELLEAGHLALEVPLEQVVVGHHDALDEVVVHLVLEGLHLVRDRLGVRDASLVEVGGVGEEVGDALELRLGADGQLERGHARAEPIAELVERAFEAGAARGRAC